MKQDGRDQNFQDRHRGQIDQLRQKEKAHAFALSTNRIPQEKRPSRLNDKISSKLIRPFKMHFLHCIVFALTALSRLVSAEISPEYLNAVTAASNASLLWGPYRSNLYFGVKPRLPNSLLTGLLWLNADDYKSFSGTTHSQVPSLHGF